MNVKHWLSAILLAGSCAGITPAFAQDPMSADDAKPGREQFCKENPATCQQIEERRRECEANPEKCKQLREERHQRREKMREACAADPKKCEEKKAEFKQRMQERREKCKVDPDSCRKHINAPTQ